MNLKLLVATLALIGSSPAFAGDLSEKCRKEEVKEGRDSARGRRHLAPDNKWDELCLPPPPPPPPPVDYEPELPPGVTPPPPPPPPPPPAP